MFLLREDSILPQSWMNGGPKCAVHNRNGSRPFKASGSKMMTRASGGNEGYNVAIGEFEDLVIAGAVDHKKVTRTALQNAASVVGLLLTMGI